MKVTKEHNERVANMVFGGVYPHYVNRIVKNGRTEEELLEVIQWLTGFNPSQVQKLIDEKATIKEFFKQAKMHRNAKLITGVICGYRIEEIDNRLTRKARYMDKLVDELARGKKMEKILRKKVK